jgi:nucleoside-diphosphate-sugar epimerase
VCDGAAPAVDLVFHLAANINTGAPGDEHRVNDEGTVNLLDWLRPVSRGARVVYASSVAVLVAMGRPRDRWTRIRRAPLAPPTAERSSAAKRPSGKPPLATDSPGRSSGSLPF